jgi:hypothetical protein
MDVLQAMLLRRTTGHALSEESTARVRTMVQDSLNDKRLGFVELAALGCLAVATADPELRTAAERLTDPSDLTSRGVPTASQAYVIARIRRALDTFPKVPGAAQMPPVGAPATRDWTVFLRRVGPIAIGTSIGEARRIVGDPNATLVQALHQKQALPREPDDSPCAYLATEKLPDQIGLMFQGGRLARVDVWDPGIRTAGGAQVGDTEARILQLYGTRIQVTPHHYPPVGAHYMIFTPDDATERDWQMLFETDGTKVTQFRVGVKDAVARVEGCA